jgi:transposase
MRRTAVLQEILKMRFTEAYVGWQGGRLTQAEAAQLLGVCERTFRRYIYHYEEDGMDGLNDKRLTQASHRRAPVDETIELTNRYRDHHQGWNAKHL